MPVPRSVRSTSDTAVAAPETGSGRSTGSLATFISATVSRGEAFSVLNRYVRYETSASDHEISPNIVVITQLYVIHCKK